MGNGDSGAVALLGGLLVLLVLGALYLIPTLIALIRKHHQIGAVAVINVLLGWTFIGWVVALAMSLSAKRSPASQVNVYSGYAYGPPGASGPPGANGPLSSQLPYGSGANPTPPVGPEPSRHPYEEPRREF